MSLPKNFLKRLLLSFGLELHTVGTQQRRSLQGVLENLKKCGLQPATVIDVGAAFGSWSRTCTTVFPQARFLLIEPLVEYEPMLQKTVASIEKAGYLMCGVGCAEKKQTLYVHPDLVGSSLKQEYEPHTQSNSIPRTIDCTTIDVLVARQQCETPILLKLDIQGAELDALAGANMTLSQTAALILEVSLIDCLKDAPVLADVIRVLQEKKFVAYDIFGHNYRPLDKALAQVDIVFVPQSSPLRATKWYANEQERKVMNERFTKEYAQKEI